MKHIQFLEHQVDELSAINNPRQRNTLEWSKNNIIVASSLSSTEVSGLSSPSSHAYSSTPSPVCTICGDRAGHHLHYGAVACFSCRQFFRRGRSIAQQCITGMGGCRVNKSNRTNCKYCRSELAGSIK